MIVDIMIWIHCLFLGVIMLNNEYIDELYKSKYDKEHNENLKRNIDRNTARNQYIQKTSKIKNEILYKFPLILNEVEDYIKKVIQREAEYNIILNREMIINILKRNSLEFGYSEEGFAITFAEIILFDVLSLNGFYCYILADGNFYVKW